MSYIIPKELIHRIIKILLLFMIALILKSQVEVKLMGEVIIGGC